MGSDPTDAFGAIRKRPWVSLLVLLVGLSTVVLLVLRFQIGFFLDDWALIFFRDGPTDWLLPHNEHIIVIPAALYELSLEVFGMTAIPLHVLAVLLFELSVILLFLWLRPLVGEPVSVLGCAVVLFLGSSVADLIWAFQIGYFGSFAAGLGALLLLRKGRLGADLLACLLLVVSLLFSSMAVPFAVAAAVQLLYRGSDRPQPAALFRRVWVFGVPALLYVGWWLGWGQHAESSISADNLLRMPVYVLSALGYAAASLTGLFSLRVLTTSYLWAIAGLAVAGGLALLLRSRRRVPPEFLIAAAAGLVLWALSALNFMTGREFFSSRYQYPAVVFLLMMLAGAFAGLRPGRRELRYLKGLAAIAVALNLAALFYGYDHNYREVAERNRASFTALDIAGPDTRPDFSVGISQDGGFKVSADDYFRVTDRYGSPAWSEEEAANAPVAARERIDQTLLGALPVVLLPPDGFVPDRNACWKVKADPEASLTSEVGSTELLIRSGQRALIQLRRFSSGVIAWATPGRPVGYRIPADASKRPWEIGFKGQGKVEVCPATSTGSAGASQKATGN